MMQCPQCKSPRTNVGYGLAGGGGIGMYMYCEDCSHIWDKFSDQEMNEEKKDDQT
jgi:hypothetical protein